jgi:alkanesulfonate monooxygenase SsuD/methylene tetrahydromethanopterin reductase-like flavin-dependent oxidoreductase (luciferase family)
VEAIAGLLSQETTTLAGQYVRLTDARCEPKPVQRPCPPITIGGRGPIRTLRAVARWAQQWNIITDSVDEWRDLKQVLVGHCERIGRDPAEITCSVNIRIGPDRGIEPAVGLTKAFRDAGVDLAIMNLPHRVTPDFLAPLADALAPLA